MHRRCVKTKPFKNSPMNMAEGNSFFRAKYTLNAATGGVSRVQRYTSANNTPSEVSK